jgi:hypothetical protein
MIYHLPFACLQISNKQKSVKHYYCRGRYTIYIIIDLRTISWLEKDMSTPRTTYMVASENWERRSIKVRQDNVASKDYCDFVRQQAGPFAVLVNFLAGTLVGLGELRASIISRRAVSDVSQRETRRENCAGVSPSPAASRRRGASAAGIGWRSCDALNPVGPTTKGAPPQRALQPAAGETIEPALIIQVLPVPRDYNY